MSQIVALMLLVTITALDDDAGYCNTLQHTYHEQFRSQCFHYTPAELLPKVNDRRMFACITLSWYFDESFFFFSFFFGLCADGGLMTKDSLPTQSTTLEALLRGEGLDKRNNSKNDEESLLEIQVCSVRKI